MNPPVKPFAPFMALCLSALSLGGCCTTKGLVKTPLGQMTRENFPSLGVSLELPKPSNNPCAKFQLSLDYSSVFQTNARLKSLLMVRMHPYWFGATVEPRYCLYLQVARVTPDEFEMFLNGKHDYLNRIYGREVKTFQPGQVSYAMNEPHGPRIFLVFRKDIRLPDGDIVVAGASLVNNDGVIPNKEEDVAAIKAILESIRPLLIN
jgi:hypothetical protein